MTIEEMNTLKDQTSTAIRNLLVEFSNQTRLVVSSVDYDVRPIYRMGTRELVDSIYSSVKLDVRMSE